MSGPHAPIAELAAGLEQGDLTSEALTSACLEAIAAHAGLNAFIEVYSDEALAEARQADEAIAAGRRRGPLHGIPVSLKDLVDVAGRPTTAGSRVRRGHRARVDAPVVSRLREAGAVIVGKCNLHEFAYGTTSEDSAFGPVSNPLDGSRSAGGSSGGSAVSVATGMAVASVGTDTGGSIRIPAAACGLVGLKPTFGEVSAEGVVPLSRSLDHVGPITRTVDDARLVLDGMTGRRSGPLKPAGVGALRLAEPRGYLLDLVDEEIRAVFGGALEALRARGAIIAATEIPSAALGPSVYLGIQLVEATAYHARTLEKHPEAYSPAVRLRLELGRYVLAEDHVRALAGQRWLRREVDTALEGFDALALPALPIPPPPVGAAFVTIGDRSEPVRSLMLRQTQLFNLTGHPAIVLPCGTTAAGLPCSLQLVGARGRTADLIAVAAACEAVFSSL
jgi:aspartyl-tRNA(Asn)/glutamyl-tRNA(Gln) amidotransferase subunit A